MRKIIFLLMLLTVLVSVIAPFYLQTRYYSLASPLKRFSSYEELVSFVNASSQVRYYKDAWGFWSGSPSFLMQLWSSSSLGTRAQTESLTQSLSVPSVRDHSTTNIQVAGVDEADIVKTDGEYIYVISGKSVIILRAYPPEEVEILSQIQLNGTIKGTFVNGDRLVIVEEASGTFARVYDISDREKPDLKRPVSVNGSYFNSRMIGNYVYVVATHPARLAANEVCLPLIRSGDHVKEIGATDIYYSDIPDYSYKFATILAVNVQNDDEEPSHMTFMLGAAHCMYVSLGNIYITLPEGIDTLIYRFHIEGTEIEYVADGGVPGCVLNQFSMDEHEGYFRIATTIGQVWSSETPSQNNLYILDMDLNIVGSLENLAPGERIYSARFWGDRCYLVTFKKVDPLFVINLEDPTNPTVLGQLKITGYSDYLHPYDENHVIGIGKETVAAEWGDFAWYQGVKISLFDVSDVENPKELAKYEIGDRGTDSPVLRDHKAFLFDKTRNLLVMPVRVAEINEEKYPNGVPPNTSGDYVWQGAYVFNMTLDQGLVLKGRITHLENDGGYYFSSLYSVKRSLYIDNVLYTISDKKIKMNNLEDLTEVNEVELP